MRVYALIHASACDYPSAGVELFRDRAKAVDAWRLAALDLEGYPDVEVDPEHMTSIGRMADQYLEDVQTTEDLEWVCGQHGWVELDEMTTVILSAVELDMTDHVVPRPLAPGEAEIKAKKRMDELKTALGLTRHKKEGP